MKNLECDDAKVVKKPDKMPCKESAKEASEGNVVDILEAWGTLPTLFKSPLFCGPLSRTQYEVALPQDVSLVKGEKVKRGKGKKASGSEGDSSDSGDISRISTRISGETEPLM
jgi:hypothetical protein